MTKELDPIWIEWPYARICREIRTKRGEVTRFVMQLEYDVNATFGGHSDPNWLVVARFDHSSTAEQGHDVTEEGLHMDVYKDGEKFRRAWDFPEIDLSDAPAYCQEYLERHAEWLLARFEEWHAIRRIER